MSQRLACGRGFFAFSINWSLTEGRVCVLHMRKGCMSEDRNEGNCDQTNGEAQWAPGKKEEGQEETTPIDNRFLSRWTFAV
jgi:hypothetical protein